ncbi:glycosyltransferase [Paracoccaceae bacterium]|nr:glycosyltransferase [Paracoccaceae bacterium]
MIDIKYDCDILILGDLNKTRPWFRDRLPSIKEAIKNSGLRILIEDFYAILEHEFHDPTDVDERPLYLLNENISRANDKFRKFVLETNPKILILGTVDNYGDVISPITIQQLRNLGIYCVGILGDDEFNHKKNRYVSSWFDSFIVYVEEFIAQYEACTNAHGIFFPNSCYIEPENVPSLYSVYDSDVVLVGAPIHERPQIVTALINAGLKVSVYGSEKWKKYRNSESYYKGFIASNKFDAAIKQSKVILAPLEDHINGSLHMNTKIWEAARNCRVPLTSYYTPLFDNHKLVEGSSIVTYKNIDELVMKATLLVNDDAYRDKIANNLYNYTKNEINYSVLYEKLFLQLSDTVNNLTAANHNTQIGSGDKHEGDSIPNNVVQMHNKITSNFANENIRAFYFDSVDQDTKMIPVWPFVPIRNISFLNRNIESLPKFLKVVIFHIFYIRKEVIHISYILNFYNQKNWTWPIIQILRKIITYKRGDNNAVR